MTELRNYANYTPITGTQFCISISFYSRYGDRIAPVCPLHSRYGDRTAPVCSLHSRYGDRTAPVCPLHPWYGYRIAPICPLQGTMPVCPLHSRYGDRFAPVCPLHSRYGYRIVPVCSLQRRRCQFAHSTPGTGTELHQYAHSKGDAASLPTPLPVRGQNCTNIPTPEETLPVCPLHSRYGDRIAPICALQRRRCQFAHSTPGTGTELHQYAHSRGNAASLLTPGKAAARSRDYTRTVYGITASAPTFPGTWVQV